MDLGTIDDIVIPDDRSCLPPGRADTAVLAGGTWLFSEKQDHLRRLVDITALGWPPLSEDESGLDIAATCSACCGASPASAWTASSMTSSDGASS